MHEYRGVCVRTITAHSVQDRTTVASVPAIKYKNVNAALSTKKRWKATSTKSLSGKANGQEHEQRQTYNLCKTLGNQTSLQARITVACMIGYLQS